MLATRDSNSIGFTAKSSQPLTMAVSRSLSSASAGQADDRDVAGLGILFEAAHHFPTVIDRHFKVHQNDVWSLGHGQRVPLLTVIRHDNREIVSALKTHLEHVAIVVVVFDVEYFGHDGISILLAARRVRSVCGMVGKDSSWPRMMM
jgi:hypothetical protein